MGSSKTHLKKLKDQVIVITGATSGIGLVTARAAARQGASVVLCARNHGALQRLTRELQHQGSSAAYVVADVGRPDDMNKLAEAAIQRFGRIDTWINNAGVSIYGRLMDITLEDQQQLFKTNFWGIVNGCRAAIPHLSSNGGALINIGSVLSDRAIPLQGIYCASKHAVKGYTDGLRMELGEQGLPISVTLIKPSAIDTPYKQHAKNYLSVEPENPPPVYAPDVVAKAILHSAQHPERDVYVGGGGKMLSSLGTYMPRTTDRYMEQVMFKQQRQQTPAQPRSDALYGPAEDMQERGNYKGHVAESSFYTEATISPLKKLTTLAGLGFLGVSLAYVLSLRPQPD